MCSAIRKLGALTLGAWFLVSGCASPYDPGASRSSQVLEGTNRSAKSSYLAFAELLTQDPKLAISERARSHDGLKVKLVGYMAELEVAPRDAFYITQIPVTCDEAGDGTADLPLTAVLVKLGNHGSRFTHHVAGPIEVTGIFNVGRVTDSNGRNAWFSLTLEELSHEQQASLASSVEPAVALE